MSELTPQQTAEVLAVSVQTLRRWSTQFAEFLGPDATPGRGRRRQYSVDDLAQLRRIADLLRSHSVDETLALMRVTPDQADTRALETMTVTDLIGEAKALQGLVMQLRGEVASQAAELERLRGEVAGLFDRQRKRQAVLETDLADLRAEVEALKATPARRSWWQRFTRQ